LAIRNIANERLTEENLSLRWLDSAGPDDTIGQLRAHLAGEPGLGTEPDDLMAAAEELGYRCELSWLNAGDQGVFDAVLTRQDQAHHMAVFAKDVPGPRSWLDYVNQPQRATIDRQLTLELREFLSDSLPGYMVPRVITVMERLPLTPNGKIDRRALAQLPLEPERPGDDEICVAQTPLEHLLVDLWEDLLNLKDVGVKDDFFGLGGNSLQALTFTARLQEQINRDIQPLALFDNATIAEFTDYLLEVFPELQAGLVAAGAGADREEGEI
jgi:hypothetical protein